MNFKRLLQQWLLLIIGVFLASQLFPGISYDSNAALIAVVILLSFLNLIIRPLLIFFALPFVILTFGLGILLINAVLFYLAGEFINGFHVNSFWTAFWASLVVSGVGFLISLAFESKKERRKRRSRFDIIDI